MWNLELLRCLFLDIDAIWFPVLLSAILMLWFTTKAHVLLKCAATLATVVVWSVVLATNYRECTCVPSGPPDVKQMIADTCRGIAPR